MIQLAPISWLFLALWIVGLGSLVWWAQSFRTQQRNLMGNMHIMFAVSGLFLVVSIGSLMFKGLNYGLDFTGGTLIEMAVYKQTTVDEVKTYLADFNTPKLGDQVIQVGADMIPDETGKAYQRVVIRVDREVPLEDGGKELRDKEPQALYDHLTGKMGESRQLRIASIGPTITGKLKSNALMAVVFALVLQATYIFFRFGFQLRFGLAADLAIVHDVVIMVGLYSLSGKQLDSPFVAALLTVAGYSIMDSVVIFDRIRENMAQHRNRGFEQVVNESVNQTMTRSINTTMTVIITLLAIYFLGGSTLQNFAFALLVGIISGAYSSIFVASPLLIIIDRWARNRDAGMAQNDVKAPARAVTTEGTGSEAAPEKARRRRGPRRVAEAAAEAEV